MNPSPLPIRSPLAPHLIISVLLGLLAVGAALLGVMAPDSVYPTAAMQLSYRPTDVVTLVLGVPFLVLAAAATARGRLLGLLAWPGAVFYLLYNYVPYLLDLPFGPGWPLYAGIVGLAAYGLVALVTIIDGEDVAERFGQTTVVRPAAGVAMALGGFLVLRTAGLVAVAIVDGVDPGSETALWATDALVAVPALVVSGVALWRRGPFGFVAVPGTLLAYFLLVLGVIPIYGIQSAAEAGNPDIAGIVILGAMALACAIPLAPMLRGLIRSSRA
jgi:hypothetical protein